MRWGRVWGEDCGVGKCFAILESTQVNSNKINCVEFLAAYVFTVIQLEVYT